MTGKLRAEIRQTKPFAAQETEAYLNVLLDPDVQAGMAKEIFNPPTNKLVKLAPPLADQILYGPRLQAVRWFDAKFVNANRARWLERINTEVVPKWRV